MRQILDIGLLHRVHLYTLMKWSSMKMKLLMVTIVDNVVDHLVDYLIDHSQIHPKSLMYPLHGVDHDANLIFGVREHVTNLVHLLDYYQV